MDGHLMEYLVLILQKSPDVNCNSAWKTNVALIITNDLKIDLSIGIYMVVETLVYLEVMP